MPPRIGKALLTAIRHEIAAPERSVGKSVLLSPQRARLFQFYCLHPLAHVVEAVRATSMSDGTVRWHGAKLVEAGWLQLHDSSYYPVGLVDPSDLPLLAVLGTESARRLLASAFALPGQSVSELARTGRVSRQSVSGLLDALQPVGLVSVVEDGAFARVYPTPLLFERREAHAPRAEAFCEAVLHRLSSAGLAPEVLRRTRSEFHVRFGPAGRRVSMDLPVDLFSNALIV